MKFLAPVLYLLIGCALLLAAIALFQDRLLYFPARATVAQMSTARLQAWPPKQAQQTASHQDPETAQAKALQTAQQSSSEPASQTFRGLVAEPDVGAAGADGVPAGRARGTAVIFHGNAGHAGHRAGYADALTRLGLRVILAEYPGYGPRDGAVGEASLVDDAAQTLVLAQQLHGAPLLVIGESLGAGVAAAAAARSGTKVTGLLLITAWDRLEHVAAFHYPWLPVRWLLRNRYDSVAHLAAFDGPVLVAVAEHDHIVPARFGTALHAALPGRKRLDVIAGAGHNDWLLRVDDAWWRSAVAFGLGEPVVQP